MTLTLQPLRRLIGPGATTTVACVAALLLELLVLQVVLPALHLAQRAATTDVLVSSTVLGIAGSLVAAGIVLVYRSLRIINFAQAAIGAGGALLCFNFLELTPVPFVVALPLGLLFSAVLGLAFDLVVGRRFAQAPRLALTVFTIAAASLLSTLGIGAVNAIPIFPDPSERPLAVINGSFDLRASLPFSGFRFSLPGQLIPGGFAEIFAVLLPVALLAGLAAFLRFTRAGMAVRAMAENSERAALLGISVGGLSGLVWAIAGALSGASSMLTGFVTQPRNALGVGALLVPALAAAVIARMSSIPVAVAASTGIALATGVINFTSPGLAPAVNGLLLVVIVIGLVTQRRRRGRSEQAVTTSWSATEEIRGVPREMRRLPVVRTTTIVLVGVVSVGVALYPFITDVGGVVLGQTILLEALIGLSLVVLTGWSGQVSLGQLGFAAVGAVVAGGVGGHMGLPFWVALPVAAAVTGAVAIAVGLPALRLPGLFLAVATFAFAAAVHDVLFDQSIFGWLLPNGGLTRPTLPFVDFTDERSMYFLCVAAVIAVLLLLANIRRTRLGRLLIAVRENEANAASAGVSVLRTKLTGFALAGAIAGFAGALMAYQARDVTALPFTADASSNIFVITVIGGVSNLAGPLLGAGLISGVTAATGAFPLLQSSIAPVLAVVLLYVAPGGLVSVAASIRDAVLRVIAQRNNIIVPSLFADMDPEALHLRLIPLGMPLSSSGISALHGQYELSDSRRVDRRRRDDIAVMSATGVSGAAAAGGAT